MKAQTLIRVSGIVLLAATVSIAMLTLVYAIQYPHLMASLTFLSGN